MEITGRDSLFFSRAPGNPLQNVNKDCTRADLSSLSASITWESISCYQVEADFGVCEYYMVPINQHRNISLSGKYVLCTINSFTPKRTFVIQLFISLNAMKK